MQQHIMLQLQQSGYRYKSSQFLLESNNIVRNILPGPIVIPKAVHTRGSLVEEIILLKKARHGFPSTTNSADSKASTAINFLVWALSMTIKTEA